MVDQKISQHRAAEGSDERCHHRVSQGRAPLSQNRKCERFWTLPPQTGQRPPCANVSFGGSRTSHLRCPSRWYLPSSIRKANVISELGRGRKAESARSMG